MWCWRRVPWTARRSNQSILKEINPEYSLEGLMLKLKLQYFGHLMWRADSDAGKDGGQEEKGATVDEMVGWHQWLNGHEFEQTPGDSEGQGGLACCSSWGHQESDTTEWVNWTELKIKIFNVTYVLHSAWTRIEQLYSKISQSREVMWDFSSMTEL